MPSPTTINPRIVEGLYCEALVLSDDVRATFAPPERTDHARDEEDPVRLALSCEGLRTITRMMHAMAWLLNHRAYFMGELSDFQLRRQGRLANDIAGADAEKVALLEPHVGELIAATERFYARLLWLDTRWRQADSEASSAIRALRERLARAVIA